MQKTIDLRKIPLEKLKKIKAKAMKLRDAGISNKEVAEKLNLDSSVLSRWYRNYLKNFKQPQEILPKGRKEGTHTKLTINQEKTIIEMLQKYIGLLDKKLVQKIIEEQYKMKIPLTTVGDYLKKWGVNARFIKNFENDFVTKIGIDKFQLVKQNIIKNGGLILWFNIMDYELTTGIKIQSIATRVGNNKLQFKIYKRPILKIDLIDFANQISMLLDKNFYVFFSVKNMELTKDEYLFKNSEKITFIHHG
ncbi:helix-turn-helix domain-containing protein [Aliarcobacter butzleri]|uniref:helix-turn-helix domain-containing protein n=1 Tax=Aliarcobacter butzleri TaxID=28197 RepID=UPI003AF73192